MALKGDEGTSASAGSAGGGVAIGQLAVVIPAHNEEQHLERALTAVRAAVERASFHLPGVDVQVVVVLDSCTDRSPSIAGGFAAGNPAWAVLPVGFRSVGRSRRAGVDAALAKAGRALRTAGAAGPMGAVWVANSDADSCVHEDWLVRQLDLAAKGADLVLGTVQPDGQGMHHQLVARWHARHAWIEDHPHVYGANLGVRASSYLAAGGFPAVEFDEDRALVDRLRSSGAAIVATDTTRVLTSGRTAGRAPRGFAAYLLGLAEA
ncbi:glycosyltransferase [Pseudarthrobacter sp. NPDC080037]|uniref:glycosyltransferase n=1 Tax=Pseudarthrobacter sp. NPDC080037 TaxID=3155289 RepID=UPI00344FE887